MIVIFIDQPFLTSHARDQLITFHSLDAVFDHIVKQIDEERLIACCSSPPKQTKMP